MALKPYKVVAGGSERQYSVLNGIKSVNGSDDDIILVHDAARPLISHETITAVIDGAKKYGGVIAAVAAKNTIKVCDNEGVVKETPDRSTSGKYRHLRDLRGKYFWRPTTEAQADGFLGTDDASLVERIGHSVHIVKSDYRNIKITTPEDIIVGEAFIKSQGQSPLIEENKQIMAEINDLIKDCWQ